MGLITAILETVRSFTFQSGYIQMPPTGHSLQYFWNFTFQSGYIQIVWPIYSKLLSYSFTFQSGYIQIYHHHDQTILSFPLHSNLVIFKSDRHISITIHYILYIPIWLYSNTSSNVQTNTVNTFTFQSGYIQMIRIFHFIECQSSLHSNLVIFKFHCLRTLKKFALSFTFQSGYIQIACRFLQSEY